MLLIADALADWLCYGMGVYSKHVYIYIYIYMALRTLSSNLSNDLCTTYSGP